MEDDLFTPKWKTSVPSRKTGEKPRMSSDSSDFESLDFSSIEKTEVLKSSAAKDRISIKPPSRRATRQSRKRKESSLSRSLPCLNEESSPTKHTPESLSATTNIKNEIKFEEKNVSELDAKKSLPGVSGTPAKNTETVKSLTSATPTPAKTPEADKSNISSMSQSTKDFSTASTITAKVSSREGASSKEKEKKVAFEEENKTASKLDSPSHSLKVSDPADSAVTLSPREGYKLKRQNRSKTLPTGSADEEAALRIQRVNSQRTPATSSPPKKSPSEEIPTATVSSSSSVKKLGMSRFSQFELNSSEPSWVSKVKQKKLEQGSSEEKDQEVTSTVDDVKKTVSESPITSKSPEPVSSPTKITPSSSNTQLRNRFNVDSSSNKGKESSEKDKDIPSSSNLSMKRPSIDISSTKRESIDIDVKELSSIKDRTFNFSNTGKTENSISTKAGGKSQQDDTKSKVPSTSPTTTTTSSSSATLSTADRARLFSGASLSNSSSSNSPSNSSKPPSGGIGHLRGGSVKTSPTKSVDPVTSFASRPGSVKGTSFSSTGVSSSSHTKPASSASPVKRVASPDRPVVTKASSTNPNISSTSNTSALPPSSKTSPTSPSSSTLKTSSQTSPANTTTPNLSRSTLPAWKASSFSVAKPHVSSSASASNNISNSNQKPPSSSSSTSSSSTPSSSSTNTTSKSPSKTQSSPIRSHASFTATSPFRPQVSSNTPSFASRTPVLTKSTSMKVNSPVVQKTMEENKKETTTTSSNVPAWRANLQKKDVKIEIIEKKSSSSSSSPQSSQSKNENLNKFGDNSRVLEMAKKRDSTPTIEKAASTSSNRSSKVLDMVKNFQNLQVTT